MFDAPPFPPFHSPNQQALRDGGWKYLSIEGDELFNLAQDAHSVLVYIHKDMP